MKTPDGERRIDLSLWTRDGGVLWHRGTGTTVGDEVSIGPAARSGLGFVVSTAQEQARFVLDRAQVSNLAEFLRYQVRRLKKSTGPLAIDLAKLRRNARRNARRRTARARKARTS